MTTIKLFFVLALFTMAGAGHAQLLNAVIGDYHNDPASLMPGFSGVYERPVISTFSLLNVQPGSVRGFDHYTSVSLPLGDSRSSLHFQADARHQEGFWDAYYYDFYMGYAYSIPLGNGQLIPGAKAGVSRFEHGFIEFAIPPNAQPFERGAPIGFEWITSHYLTLDPHLMYYHSGFYLGVSFTGLWAHPLPGSEEKSTYTGIKQVTYATGLDLEISDALTIKPTLFLHDVPRIPFSGSIPMAQLQYSFVTVLYDKFTVGFKIGTTDQAGLTAGLDIAPFRLSYGYGKINSEDYHSLGITYDFSKKE